MQDPCGRLPAPDSYAGSAAPSITGFGGHPTRFSRLRASRATSTTPICLSRGSDGVLVAVVLGLSGGVLTGLLLGYGQDRDGRSGMERKLLLEIMRRFVALPWVRKLGSLAPPACAGRWRRGFPAIRRSRPGRKVHSVMVCRRPSPFDLGPFEAGY